MDKNASKILDDCKQVDARIIILHTNQHPLNDERKWHETSRCTPNEPENPRTKRMKRMKRIQTRKKIWEEQEKIY